MKKYIILIFIFRCLIINGQNWYKTYPGNNAISYNALEAYDKGFLISGFNLSTGALLKTDVNGNILWTRCLGIPSDSDSAYVTGLCTTKDGGVLVAGEVNRTAFSCSLFFLKINECGQKVWGKIYKLNAYGGGNCYVHEQSSGDFCVVFYFDDYLQTTKNCGVLNLDKTGNIIWQTYTALLPNNLMIDNYGNIIVTGNIWVPYPDGSPDFVYVHSDVTRIDKSGAVKWESIFGVDTKELCDGRATSPAKDGGYLMAGIFHDLNKGRGAIFLVKYDSLGHSQWSKTAGDTSKEEGPADMCRINDSSFIIIGMQFDQMNSAKSQKLIIEKVSINGAILKRNILNTKLFPVKINPTMDGKFIISGRLDTLQHSFIACMKINSDLEIDSFYAMKYHYDSLCTGTIKSVDTIRIKGFDTGHIKIPYVHTTGINFITGNVSVRIYPNPFYETAAIEYTLLNISKVNISLSDITGKQFPVIMDKEQPAGNYKIDLNGYAYHLKSGIYIVKFEINNQVRTMKIVKL
jgi:hypothetical protein